MLIRPHRLRDLRRFLTVALLTLFVAGPAFSASGDDEDFGSALGLADAAALQATVFGPRPETLAELPEKVPTQELNIVIDGAMPVPDIYWFNRKLRVYFSAQQQAAPLAIVIAGTGGGADTAKLGTLRRALYEDGYHVLTLPSPTFPGFIVAASSTGVAGDLWQDGRDLHRAASQIVRQLEARHDFTEIVALGYSLGGANAATLKALDDEAEEPLGIPRAVLINPPVSLFSSIERLDKLLELSIGDDEKSFERFYHEIYTELSRHYAATDAWSVDQGFLLEAAARLLDSDRKLAAGVSLSFRMSLIDMFFAGDLYAGSGAVVDPDDPPRRGDSLESVWRELRGKTFATYFEEVFAPFYLAHRPSATRESLIAANHLESMGEQLRTDPAYYAQTNADEVILDGAELDWLRDVFGDRLAVYDHGGHLGSVGTKEQIADMLRMAAGTHGEARP